MQCMLSLLLVCLWLPGGVASQEEDAKKDQEALQGKWDVIKIVADGREVPEDKIRGVTLVVKDDTMALTEPNSAEKLEFSFKLDTGKKPKGIDTTPSNGPFQGKKVSGIYELNGTELKLCLPNDENAARPTEFNTTPGSKLALLVLKRAK